MKTKWVGPVIFLGFGVAGMELSLLWNHPSDGLWLLAGSLAFAAALALGGRSDTVRGPW